MQIIPVGKPHCPVSTEVRRHNRSLVASTTINWTICIRLWFPCWWNYSLSSNFPNIPISFHDPFFSGKEFFTLKDKVLQPYNAMQHTTKLIKIIKANFRSQLQSARILMINSDGGSDHHLTFVSVKLGMIALFKP